MIERDDKMSDEEKFIKKQEREKRNEPPVLSLQEEVINSLTHGIGAVLAIIAMILLLRKSTTPLMITASCFYGISLIFMMLMSCLYHAFKSQTKLKRIWRRFDYMSIYFLIGATFAPLYLVYWGNQLGIILFIIQWIVVIFGVTMIAIFGPGKWSALHFTLYFSIGWSGIIFLPYMYEHSKPLLMMILSGGLVYTLGMIPFAKHTKYAHCVWHIFVLGGAILHWIGIYNFVY